MATLLLQIAALLVLVIGTFASEDPCPVSSQKMDCTNKDLTAPPSGLWTGIRTLYLINNPITEFSNNSFTGFPYLYHFLIRNASVSEIDLGDFVVMTYLQTLTFQSSNIKTIIPAPEGTKFPALFQFNVESNLITTLDPKFLFNTPNLSVLKLIKIPIELKNGDPVVKHGTLKSIYIGEGSDFSDLDIDALLSGLPSLTFVEFAESQLKDITGAFVNLKKLATVKLANNSISEITSNTFASEGKISILVLVGNPLTRLDTDAVDNAMKKFGWIDFKDTPLACNCLYEELYWWAISKGVTLYAGCGGVNLCSFTRR